MRRTFIYCCMLFLGMNLGWANSNLQLGWKYFAENKLNQATSEFKKALSSPQKAEALLGLCYIETALSHDEQAFQYYAEFYKASDNPDPYLYALWSLNGGEMTDAKLDFIESIAKTRKGSLRAFSQQALGSHYKMTTKLSDAKEAYAKTGAIGIWQMVGDFENISESGFDKSFGALEHPEKSHKFTNKRGVEVEWFDLKQPRMDNWVDFEYHFYTDDAIIYAQNWTKSPNEQEVQFRLGTSGSAKVWVNDKLLFSEPEERDNGLDTYVFTAKLMKGYNRILIQIGASEISNSNFLLRITDDAGENIQGLEHTTKLQPYPKNYFFTSKQVANPNEVYLKKQLKENPDNLLYYLVLTQFYLRNDFTYEAKKLLKQAKKKFPDCSYITYQLIETFARDGNRTGFSTYLEELKEKDPNSHSALILLFDEAMDIKDYDKAEEILGKIEKGEGNSPFVMEKKIAIASAKEEIEELVSLVNQAYAKYPDNYSFNQLKYAVEKELRKNNTAAAKVWKTYLKKHYNYDAIRTVAVNYLRAGDVSKGIDQIEKLIEYNPISVGSYSLLSNVYFNIGNYNKAAQYKKECIRIAPYIGSYHESLARSYEERGEDAEARKSYEKAIYYNPYDYDAKEGLRGLLGKKDIFENFNTPDVYEIYKNSPDASEYPEDNSIILLDEVQNVAYESGGYEQKNILLIKVFNTDGVDRWKEYSIPVYNNQSGIVEHVEVLKKNGSKLEAERDGRYVVFPNLEPGDAIHINYKVKNYYSGKLSNQFWDKHYFTYFYPIQVSRYSLMVPEGRKFQYKVLNGELEPKKTNVDGYQRFVWEKKDVPSIKYEPYMSSLADIGMSLHTSSFENWDYISEWYADIAKAKSKVDFEVQEAVNELFPEEEDMSEREVVQKIYEYIVNEIRYSSVPFLQSGLIPQKASRVITTKQGDCKDVSSLFVAMCKAKGIDANLVLINTRDNGLQDLLLPSISFNHCIAKVNLDNTDYFVELTDDNLPFGSGSVSVKNAFSLEIPANTLEKVEASLLNPPSRIRNHVIRNSRVSFAGDDIMVEKKCRRSGVFASGLRNSYENEGKETQFKMMQEAVTGVYPSVKLKSVDFDESLTNNADEMTYGYSYKATSVFTEISDLKIVKLPWSDALSAPDFLSLDERKYPIELWDYTSAELYEETLNIQVPAGMKVSEVPQDESYSSSNATYSLSFKMEGEVLKVVRRFEIKNDIVQPENYQEFKQFFSKLVKADDRRIAFKAI
ncbi:MAG: DUF3857 domain-containing protein [Bacteroidota bacterium]